MSVTYAFGDSREVLDSTTIRSWMTVSESGEASFSDEQIEDYVAGLAEKYDCWGSARKIGRAGNTKREANRDVGYDQVQHRRRILCPR